MSYEHRRDGIQLSPTEKEKEESFEPYKEWEKANEEPGEHKEGE